MLARLWWKEGRTLAPIAATVFGSAMVLQWFLLTYGGVGFRNGDLVPLGICWAILYALVAGSSSFAGERENRMMGFLDALPVGRSILWLGKATFAVASSLGLAVALMLVGLGGTTHPRTIQDTAMVGFLFGGLLVEATVLGLFWSAYCRNAITAGIFAVLSTGLMVGAVERWFPIQPNIVIRSSGYPIGPGPVSTWGLLVHLALIAGALAASWAAMNWEFAVASSSSRIEMPGTLRRRRQVLAPSRRPRLSILPSPAFWSVAWQTIREGRTTWLQTVGLGLLAPTILLVGGDRAVEPPYLIALFILAAIVQGTSVFGLENSAGTRAFLDNQAVPPRTVWAAKVSVWGMGWATFLAIIVLGSILFSIVAGRGIVPPQDNMYLLAILFILALAGNFVLVPMICGMVFTRRITATMVSILALIVVLLPQQVVLYSQMISPWSQAATPLILLAVSWFWAGDWLANRSGWRRWARLAGLIVVPFGGLVLAYVAGRAWGVPDIGPQYRRERPISVGEINLPADAERDLAGRYLGLVGPLTPRDEREPQMDLLVESHHTRITTGQLAELHAHAGLVEQARTDSKTPTAVDFGKEPSLFQANTTSTTTLTLGVLMYYLTLDTLERESRGDLAGAWDDILAEIRIADQFARGARSIDDHYAALRYSERATRLGFGWANNPKITVEAIRNARKSIEAVLDVPTTDRAIRGESERIERALDQPTAEWVDYLSPPKDEFQLPWTRIKDSWVVAPAWERERTRRIARQLTVIALGDASRNLLQPTGFNPFLPDDGRVYLRTPLSTILSPFLSAEYGRYRELTNRQLFVTFLALRAWQVTNHGIAPASLEQLIPSELANIPIDPYSRSRDPFVYRDVSENEFQSSGPVSNNREDEVRRRGRHFVLSSVGADGIDENQRSGWFQLSYPGGHRENSDDLIYSLPRNPIAPKDDR